MARLSYGEWLAYRHTDAAIRYEQQLAKLRLVVEMADEAWGSRIEDRPRAAVPAPALPRGAGREVTSVGTRDEGFVQSLERGLAVIRALTSPPPGLTITEVARATGLTRAAARRCLVTLERLGYVAGNGRRFALTPRVLELGYAYLSSLNLPQIAQPHIERLAEEVQESAAVSVLDGTEIVCIGGVTTKRLMTVSVRVGGRLPAHVTSAGRLLLAELEPEQLDVVLAGMELRRFTRRTIASRQKLRWELDRARRQGWALVDQEFEEGLIVVGVPIRDAAGNALAVVNLFTHVSRTSVGDAERSLLPPLLAAAGRIESDLALAGQPGAATGAGA
jgi:IclR family transcriptional regulator, pca regulon regulatory protein